MFIKTALCTTQWLTILLEKEKLQFVNILLPIPIPSPPAPDSGEDMN